MDTGSATAATVGGATILGLSLGMIQGLLAITLALITIVGSMGYLVYRWRQIRLIRSQLRTSEEERRAAEMRGEYFRRKAKKEGLLDEEEDTI